MTRYILIFVYIAINILLFVLNWDLFTIILDFDLGFGTFKVLPFFILQVIGLLVLGIFAVIDGMKDLKREVLITDLQKKLMELQKDTEIAKLKEEKKLVSTTQT